MFQIFLAAQLIGFILGGSFLLLRYEHAHARSRRGADCLKVSTEAALVCRSEAGSAGVVDFS